MLRDITGRMGLDQRISGRCGSTSHGTIWKAIALALTSFCAIANASLLSHTSASTPDWARSMMHATGSSTATNPATLSGRISGARTDASSLTKLGIGRSATKSMVHGRWGTRARKSMRPSRSRRPRPCARSIGTLSSSPAGQVIMAPIGLRGIASCCRRFAIRRITSPSILTSITATMIWKDFSPGHRPSIITSM